MAQVFAERLSSAGKQLKVDKKQKLAATNFLSAM